MIPQTYIARHLTAQNSYQRTLHFHDVNELLFSLNDGCSFFLDDQVYDIRPGALVLIPEGAIHRKINPPTVTVDTYTLLYPPSLLDAYSTPHTDLTQVYGSTAKCIQLPEELIARATELFKRSSADPDDAFGSDLQHNMLFLEMLLTFYPLLASPSDKTTPHSNISPLVSEIIAYINQHLAERLTLELLSGTFFVSRYNLCRQFKKETGFTVIEYINSSRIRMACSILRREKDASNVGARVGFPNASHFIHTFRQYIGITPHTYKKRYQSSTNVPVFGNFSPHDG